MRNPPKLILYSGFDTESVRQKLGAPQYSYHFVLTGYLPALRQLGEVVHVQNPEAEVDALYDECQAKGQTCLFLCFAPPHLVPITLRCPTIPVIAWEFSNIPTEMWSDDPRSDWRNVFRHCGRAITLSRHTAALVREAMGPDFPVFAIPTATYDGFAPLFAPAPRPVPPREISFHGMVFDSAAEPRLRHVLPWPPETPPPPELPPPPPPIRGIRARLSRTLYFGEQWYQEVARDALPGWSKSGLRLGGRAARRLYRAILPHPPAPPPPAPPPEPEHKIRLSGIVYGSVFSPEDGRKNWHDLLTGFLWAFRDEPGATLVLKMPRGAWETMHPHFDHAISRFAPLACRIVLIYGFLDDAEYATLVRATDFYANASNCEGLCIPLMEFLAAGKPAIAPCHTAMADYVTPRAAFIPRASLEHNVWPFDPRDLFRTMRYRLDWTSLEAAYRDSFHAALAADGTYERMSRAAHDALREYASTAKVRALLAEALRLEEQNPVQEAAE